MQGNERCAVLVPVASQIEPETEDALRLLASQGYAVRTLRYCSQVDLARSILATDALRDGFQETLWVDADIVFTPADVERLRGHGEPFVAGPYVKKGRPEFAGKFLDGIGETTFGTGGELLEVRYVGMGFTLVRAEVYAAVKEKCGLPECGGGYDPAKPVVPYFIPSLARDGAGGWCYLSEDYSFCHRAREVGFPAVLDTVLKLGHVGRQVRTWDDMLPRQMVTSLGVRFEYPPLKPVEMPQAMKEHIAARNAEKEPVLAAANGEGV